MVNAKEIAARLWDMSDNGNLEAFEALGKELALKGLEIGEPSAFNDVWMCLNVMGAPGPLKQYREALESELAKLG